MRAQFILESVAALRAALQERGSELVIRCGRAENVIGTEFANSWVYTQEEVTSEELEIDNAVAKYVLLLY